MEQNRTLCIYTYLFRVIILFMFIFSTGLCSENGLQSGLAKVQILVTYTSEWPWASNLVTLRHYFVICKIVFTLYNFVI